MFVKFGRIFFPRRFDWLLLKNVKQARFLKKNELGRNVFHHKMKYFYEEHCPGYTGVPHWTSGIPPGRDEMKNVPSSYKHNKKIMKKWL